ncbi:rab effector Noc2-like isoform X2 [Centruroides vittatus]|uniref:rab effector Noc2-like isoform X2 n=1 Tax=Centruroides vittatus TaxID=120091 RepID=UPI0035103915
MVDFGVSRDRWVCPSDRELALRAKLNTGWSVKTSILNSYVKPQQISDVEIETVIKVLKRAECIEQVEKERIGRLVERLENMKKNAIGNGVSQCVLCADRFGFLGASPVPCHDCCKAVCGKCGVDTVNAESEPLWLCKICAETREMWKKSGAWFLKRLPEYILPKKKLEQSKYGMKNMPSEDSRLASSIRRPIHSWSLAREGAYKESTDSSDDDVKMASCTQPSILSPQENDSDEESDSETGTVRTVITSRKSCNLMIATDSASTSEESCQSYIVDQWDNLSENSRLFVNIDPHEDNHDIKIASICESMDVENSSGSSPYLLNESGYSSVKACTHQRRERSSSGNGGVGVKSEGSLDASFDRLSTKEKHEMDDGSEESNKRTTMKMMRKLKQSILKPYK